MCQHMMLQPQLLQLICLQNHFIPARNAKHQTIRKPTHIRSKEKHVESSDLHLGHVLLQEHRVPEPLRTNSRHGRLESFSNRKDRRQPSKMMTPLAESTKSSCLANSAHLYLSLSLSLHAFLPLCCMPSGAAVGMPPLLQ